MKKLWVRLTLAFAVVTVTGILVVALLANQQVSTEFRRFVARSQVIDSELVASLAEYYARNGGWDGVETVLPTGPGPGGMGAGRGMRRGGPALILADADGRVVYDQSGQRLATRLSGQELSAAVPIERQNQTVGYLLVSVPGQADLTPEAARFLTQINRALLQAGLISGTAGVLLGLAVARGLSAPLRRLAVAARRISRGELDQRVPVGGAEEIVEVAQAFNDMAASLQQAERRRRTLVADIAHELRTPLSVLQGNLQAILDDVYPLEKSEVATIYDETLILSRLVADLHELAQVDAGQLNLNIHAVEVAPLVERVVALFEEPAAEHGTRLALALPADLPPVLADPDRTRQVLYNLLANALRYSPAGSQIRVQVERLDRSDEASRLAPDSRDETSATVRISVIDTGPGIPAEERPSVFDRFWRADRARSRQKGGSGLGLTIAKQLVEAQGGQIGVESEVGRGSCFWFTLRVATDTTALCSRRIQ